MAAAPSFAATLARARAAGSAGPCARAPTGDLRTTVVVVDSAGGACGLRDGCHRNKSTSGLSGISTF